MKQDKRHIDTTYLREARRPGRKVRRAKLREAGVFRAHAARRRRWTRTGGYIRKPGEGFQRGVTVTNPEKARALAGKARIRARRTAARS